MVRWQVLCRWALYFLATFTGLSRFSAEDRPALAKKRDSWRSAKLKNRVPKVDKSKPGAFVFFAPGQVAGVHSTLSYLVSCYSVARFTDIPILLLSMVAIPEETMNILRVLGVQSRIVDPVNHRCDGGVSTETKQRLSRSYAKVELWNQTDFSRIVFLDSTTVVLRNIDALFKVESPIAATMKGGRRTCNWGRCSKLQRGTCVEPMSTQVLVVEPHLQTFYEGLDYLSNRRIMNTFPKHMPCRNGEKSFLNYMAKRRGGFECLDRTFNCYAGVGDNKKCGEFNQQADLKDLLSPDEVETVGTDPDPLGGIHVMNFQGENPWFFIENSTTRKDKIALWHFLDCIRERGERCIPSLRNTIDDRSEEKISNLGVWFRTLGEFLVDVPAAMTIAIRQLQNSVAQTSKIHDLDGMGFDNPQELPKNPQEPTIQGFNITR